MAKPGDRVFYDRWGFGTVTEVNPLKPDQIKVKFDNEPVGAHRPAANIDGDPNTIDLFASAGIAVGPDGAKCLNCGGDAEAVFAGRFWCHEHRAEIIALLRKHFGETPINTDSVPREVLDLAIGIYIVDPPADDDIAMIAKVYRHSRHLFENEG